VPCVTRSFGLTSFKTMATAVGRCTPLLGLLGWACQDRGVQTGAPDLPPKVILIIGDGMDDQQITIGRNYLVGQAGRLVLDTLPYRGAAQAQTVDENDPSQPVYVADSANTATAIATGVVTSRGRIATTAGTDRDLPTILELAEQAGLATGIVTTSDVTDATPASFVAHVNQRYCQGPADMVRHLETLNLSIDCSSDYKANGGRGSIAEQIAASNVDIVLGGGMLSFDQAVEGDATRTVLDAAAANGYRLIQTRASLDALPADRKILGLFSPSTMPVKLRAEGGARLQRIERIDDRIVLPEAVGCEPNPAFEGMPSLEQMTQVALDRLDAEAGFVLVVESASIDKQSHLRRPCGHIGELDQLEQALRVALAYAANHPETLILVTADHTHAAQIVPETSSFQALNFASPGYFTRLRTPEGGIMGINYATNDSPIQEEHTGAQVPVFASGPNLQRLPSFMHQADLFTIMLRHLELDAAGDFRLPESSQSR